MPSPESMPAQAMSAPGSAAEAPLPVLAGERAFAPADVRSRRPTEIPRGALLIIDGDGVLNETRYPERFIDAVDLLANDYQAEVQMVFDGTRIQPTPQLGSRDRIQVRFTQGVTVPEVISRMLTAVEGQPNTIVASDNSEVVASVRRARGSAMSTGELIAALVG